MQLLTGIPTSELEARRARLLEFLENMSLTGCVLFDDRYVQYFTSFNFLATERPVGVAMNAAGELAVFVPEFEVERVRAETAFERVESYPEYPGIEHPMQILGGVLEEMGFDGAARRRQRRLSGHPRLPGAGAERGDGGGGHALWRR